MLKFEKINISKSYLYLIIQMNLLRAKLIARYGPFSFLANPVKYCDPVGKQHICFNNDGQILWPSDSSNYKQNWKLHQRTVYVVNGNMRMQGWKNCDKCACLNRNRKKPVNMHIIGNR
jgi:hypothetical protein